MTTAGKRLLQSAKQAALIARGELEPVKIHVPPEIDVKSIRAKLAATQDDFASEFGFTINQIRDWEQARTRPLGSARTYLMLIERNPEVVRSLLREARALTANSNDGNANDRRRCV
jgi:putative transcriptional regulator